MGVIVLAAVLASTSLGMALSPFAVTDSTATAAAIAGFVSVINTVLNAVTIIYVSRARAESATAAENAAIAAERIEDLNGISDVAAETRAIVERRKRQSEPHPHRRETDD